MHRVIILGVLACTVATSAADRIQIGIRLQTPPTMPPSLVKAVIAETERLWNFPSLKLNWHQQQRPALTPDNRLLIVRFLGKCELMRSDTYSNDVPLGFTHVSDNIILPFIDVSCGAVSATLSLRHREGSFLRHDAYARALAAVLTHEMVHALTGKRDHDSAGVMQAKLSPSDLEYSETGPTHHVIETLEGALHVELSESQESQQ